MNEELAHLRRYAETGAEEAFAAVVERCLPLVYGAARRRLGGDAHRARDVAQLVFVALARNAATVAQREELCGWLFTTTHFLAAKLVRTERRRAARETEAELMNTRTTEGVAGEAEARWHAVLDEVTAELRQLDRDGLLLRFYRGLRWAEIAARLEVTENAAQKRVERALETLREKLARRGVTSTAAAVALALESHGAVTVPAGLAASVTTAAVTCGVGGAGALAWAGEFMATNQLVTGIAAAVALAGIAGFGWQYRENERLRTDMARRDIAVRSEVGREWEQKLAAQVKRAEAAEADVGELLKAVGAAAKVRSGPAPLEKWRYDLSLARADALTKEGRWQEALEELVRCYRELRAIQRNSPQSQTVTARIKSLADRIPAAEGALRDLREVALRELQGNPEEPLLLEIARLNARLGEGALLLSLYDALPRNLWMHPELRLAVADQLVQARRYRDASQVKTFDWMAREIEIRIKEASDTSFSPNIDKRAWVNANVLGDIEILTGAGKLPEARMLTEKVLAFDSSEATRAAIQRHVERAGGR